MIDPDQLYVLVPDEIGGLAACPFVQVMAKVLEGTDLDSILMDAAIDSCGPEDTEQLINRVRVLNDTGDTDAFWGEHADSN